METLLEKVIGLDFTVCGWGDRWRKTEEHSSLVLDLVEQRWYWNSKSLSGSPKDYLMFVKGLRSAEADNLINSLVCVSPSDLSFPGKQSEVVVNESLVDVFWENGKGDRDYWYRRLLTDKTIDIHKLGKYDGFWTLPIYMDGKFRNFQCRTDFPEKKIRPWYRGVGPLLVNSSVLSFTDYVFITEGPVDALLLNQKGFPAVSHTGGAGGWRDEWFSYFMNQKTIYYIADNDPAGYKAAHMIASSLGENRVKIVAFKGKEEKYDTVQFYKDGGTDEEFKALVENCYNPYFLKELYAEFHNQTN